MTGIAPEPMDRAIARILAGGFTDPVAVVCPNCLNTGHACENHPDKPWAYLTGPHPTACDCGGAGMPCPTCCGPVPGDGRHSIREAFIPRHLRNH